MQALKQIKNFSVKTVAGQNSNKTHKTNQDSFIISQNFCKLPHQYLFAVCDGHGINGHQVSQFIKQQLPSNIQQSILQTLKIEPALIQGFERTQINLLQSGIDITFSGSTCVSLIITSNSYYCANIGDSRAILAKQRQNQWIVQPLSQDHKPDLEKEMQRIIQSGGEVKPLIDQDGNPIGPARVWIKDENIPGLAMSRSFGDYVANQVGVSCEPEVFCKQFDHEEDKFFVICSDGVWEFLSNEDVIELVVPYYIKNQPDEACQLIVKKATEAWIKEDEVVDDITVIVVFL